MKYKIKFKHRLKIYQWIIGFFIFFMICFAACAATNEPSWVEHIDLVNVFILILFSIVSWFVIKTLTRFENNQDLLFTKYNDHEHRLSKIEGAHESRVADHKDC